MNVELFLQPKQIEVGELVYARGVGASTTIGAGGSRAGGKSGGLRRVMLDRRQQFPGTFGCIVRRTWPDLDRNHVQRYFIECPELRDMWYEGKKKFVLPNKSEIHCMFAENQQEVDGKFWGPEFYDIFIDQAEQFTEKELVTIKTANRWPGAGLGECKTVHFFNPGGVGTEYLRRIYWTKKFHGNENPRDFAFRHMFGWDNYVWFEPLGITPHEFYELPDGLKLGEVCPYGDGGHAPEYRCCRFHLFIHQTAEGRKLNGLPRTLRAGHLLGSFEQFAGQYFAGVWDESKVILSASQEAKLIQPWWARWLSHDDGFVHHACMIWWVTGMVSPKLFEDVFGVKISEPVKVVIAYRDFAEQGIEQGQLIRICRKKTTLVENKTLGRYFLSVDAWEEDSHGNSVADTIAQECRVSEKITVDGRDLYATWPAPEQADNARIGGWRFLYAMMKKTGDVLDGKMNPTRSDDDEDYETESRGYSAKTPLLFVSGNCNEIIESVPMAISDDKHIGRAEDVLKQTTKSDDVCFAAGTNVWTRRGQIGIEKVKITDEVMTRQGWRRVAWPGMTSQRSEVVEAYFSDGRKIVCTRNHPFFTHNRGFIPLDGLRYDDKLMSWNQLSLTGSNTHQCEMGTFELGEDYSTETFGSSIAARFRRNIISTIAIMRLCGRRTLMSLSALRQKLIPRFIKTTANGGQTILLQSDRWPQNGIEARKEGLGTVSMLLGGPCLESQGNALSADSNSWAFTASGIAQMFASLQTAENPKPMMYPASAWSVMENSEQTGIPSRNAVGEGAVRFLGYATAGFAAVYNLEVVGEHEFFANGLLVHNCDALRYGAKSMLNARGTPFPVEAAEIRMEMEQSGRSMTEVAIRMLKLNAEQKNRGKRRSRWAR